MAKAKKPPKDTLTRAIEARERSIRRMETDLRRVQAIHEADEAERRKRIAEKRVLLDALKRGQLEA